MNIKRILTWLSVIGSIASVIGIIYIFIPFKENNIRLDFIISSIDNLTVFNNTFEPEIKAQFEYKGSKITNLWKINVILRNSTDKTILGEGQLKNIMHNEIIFFTKAGCHIIDKKKIKSDFNHTLDVLNNDTIKLRFSQWRTNEKLEYSFYVTADSSFSPNLDMFDQPMDRQIVDGDIFFLKEIQSKEKVLITNNLGKPAKKVSYTLFIVISILLLILSIIIFISNIVGYSKRKIWKKNNLNKYNDFIRNQFANDKGKLNKFLDKPELFSGWTGFKGDKYPNEWGMDFTINKFYSLISVSIIMLALCLVQIILIIDLIQLFP